jgi:hypothetical protein
VTETNKPWPPRTALASRAARILLVTLTWVVAGCVSPGWTVYVYNNTSSPVLVRFAADDRTTVQPLAPDQQGFVFDGPRRPGRTTLEFLDPASCDVMASTSDMPRVHPMLVFSGDADIEPGVDDPGDQPRVLLSVTTDCLPAP